MRSIERPSSHLWQYLAVLVLMVVATAIFIRTAPHIEEQANLPSLDSDTAQPLTCPAWTTGQHVARADLIVTATVFAVVSTDSGANVLVTPDIIYKGGVPEEGITVAAQPSELREGRSENQVRELHFASSDPPYLLYLRKRPDGRYTTSVCDGSRLLGAGLTDEEQSALTAI